MAQPRAIPWPSLPEVGIPEDPVLARDGQVLWLAFFDADDHIAVVRFDGVVGHRYLGRFNDEGLGKHPFFSTGLKRYYFHEIADSPVRGLDGPETALLYKIECSPGNADDADKGRTARHWIATFKDGSLDVIAQEANLLAVVENGTDLQGALDAARRDSVV